MQKMYPIELLAWCTVIFSELLLPGAPGPAGVSGPEPGPRPARPGHEAGGARSHPDHQYRVQCAGCHTAASTECRCPGQGVVCVLNPASQLASLPATLLAATPVTRSSELIIAYE